MTTTNTEVKGVDIFSGPKGTCGFRSGYWIATCSDGRKFRFYGSLSHCDGLNEKAMIEKANLCLTTDRVDWLQP